MGWECGFESLTKFKDTDVSEAINVTRILEDSTFEADIDVLDSLQEKLKHYKYHKEGNYDRVPYTINYWCSAGKTYLDDYITAHLEPVFNGEEEFYYGIDLKFVNDAIIWASNELQKVKLEPIEVIKAYTDEKDKVGSLVKCEGLEVLDEYGNRKFISTESNYFFVAEKDYYEDRQYVLENFIETMKIISKMDFEKNLIWYYRCW
jgi:hypothetical protein